MNEPDSEAAAGIEPVLDELLALPPADFTAARNAAARQLRVEGRRAAADALKSVPRPPVSLWALNRLAREQPSLIADFLAAADQLREAYRSGGDIRAATAPERAAEASVVEAAGALARAAGMNVTEVVSERLRQTVRAAASVAETAAALRAGRLTREPEAPSLDDLLGSMSQGASAAEPARQRQDERTRRRALERRIAAAEQAAAEAHRDDRAAAEAAREARKTLQRVEASAERTRQRSQAADEHLRDLQGQLADL